MDPLSVTTTTTTDPVLLVISYCIYLAISICLTVWVARTLSHNGRVFLVDILGGDARLADAVNHLLVVGFYLVNLGFISLAMRSPEGVGSVSRMFETLSSKLGVVMLVLGGMHLFNVYVFNRIRRDPARRASRSVAAAEPAIGA